MKLTQFLMLCAVSAATPAQAQFASDDFSGIGISAGAGARAAERANGSIAARRYHDQTFSQPGHMLPQQQIDTRSATARDFGGGYNASNDFAASLEELDETIEDDNRSRNVKWTQRMTSAERMQWYQSVQFGK